MMVRHHEALGPVELGKRAGAHCILRATVKDQPAVETRELGDLLRHNADVVRHQHQRRPELPVQMAQQAVELLLGINVHPDGGLVGRWTGALLITATVLVLSVIARSLTARKPS